MSKLIEEIKKLQEKKGLSDPEFAKELGVDYSHLNRIKRGLRPPGNKFLRALAMKYPSLRKHVYRYIETPDKETAAI